MGWWRTSAAPWLRLCTSVVNTVLKDDDINDNDFDNDNHVPWQGGGERLHFSGKHIVVSDNNDDRIASDTKNNNSNNVNAVAW